MFRCLVLFGLLVAVQSAIIHKRDIPVEVVYDKENAKSVADPIPGVRNLNEKIQLSPEEIKEEALIQASSTTSEAPVVPEKEEIKIGVKNLDEKVQLSPEDLNVALKHLPVAEDVVVEMEKSQPVSQLSVIQQAQEIIVSGLRSIKEKVNSDKLVVKPTDSEWDSLNRSVEKLLEEQAAHLQLRQDNPTTSAPVQNQNNQNQIIQNIVNGFSNLTAIFSQNFQQSNKPPTGSEDEQQGQQPGFFQNFINQFQGGVNQVVNNLNNINGGSSTQSTVLGDTGVTPSTNRPNFINNVVSSVQQLFQGNNNQGNPIQGVGLNQSDEGVSTTARPGGNPVQIFQNLGNQIGSFFGQGNNNKPAGSEDEGSGSTTSAPNFIQSIGQVFQGVFRPDNSQGGQGGQSGQGGQGGQGGSNPINVVNNQIQQLVDNASSGGAGGNPVESIQNAISGGASSTEKAKIDPAGGQQASSTAAASSSAMKVEQKEIMETIE